MAKEESKKYTFNPKKCQKCGSWPPCHCGVQKLKWLLVVPPDVENQIQESLSKMDKRRNYGKKTI